MSTPRLTLNRMRRPRRIGVVLLTVGVVLLLFGLLIALGADSGGTTSRAAMRLTAQVRAADSSPGTFGVSGDKDGLYPGNATVMPIVITNPNPFDIQIDHVDAVATSETAACPASNVDFGDITERVVVPANGTAQSGIHVGTPASADDRCQGVTFRLTFDGTAGPAPGVVVPETAASPSVSDPPGPGASVLGATSSKHSPLSRTGAAATRPLVMIGLTLILVGIALSRAACASSRPG